MCFRRIPTKGKVWIYGFFESRIFNRMHASQALPARTITCCCTAFTHFVHITFPAIKTGIKKFEHHPPCVSNFLNTIHHVFPSCTWNTYCDVKHKKYPSDLNVSHLLKRSTTRSEINNRNKTLVVTSSSRISKAQQLEQNKNATAWSNNSWQHETSIRQTIGCHSTSFAAPIAKRIQPKSCAITNGRTWQNSHATTPNVTVLQAKNGTNAEYARQIMQATRIHPFTGKAQTRSTSWISSDLKHQSLWNMLSMRIILWTRTWLALLMANLIWRWIFMEVRKNLATLPQFPLQAPKPSGVPRKNCRRKKSTRSQEPWPNGRSLWYQIAKLCYTDPVTSLHISQQKEKGHPSKATFDVHGTLPTMNLIYKVLVVGQGY